MEVQHQRAFADAPVGHTAIDLTLETRGRDHLQEILACLEEISAHVEKLP
jgi:threonine dehydratase